MLKFKNLNRAATLLGLSPMSLYYYLLNNPYLEGNQAELDYPNIIKFFQMPCDNAGTYVKSLKKIKRCLDVLVDEDLIKCWTIKVKNTNCTQTLYSIIDVSTNSQKCTQKKNEFQVEEINVKATLELNLKK